LVNSSNNHYSFSLYKIYPNEINCGYCNNPYKRIRGNITVKTISKIENINSSYIDKDSEKIFFKFKSENEVDINYLKINSNITSSSDIDQNFIDNKQEKENDERILINFSTKENNKENILFYQFDQELNKTTYLLRLPKNKAKNIKLENIFKKLNDNNGLYFMIDKEEINYIYYCFVLSNEYSYKEIINKEISYKEHQLENDHGLNKVLMSVYLNEENIESEINEFKLAKEYQILSKNSCLFLMAENENIITNINIESCSYSRKNIKNIENICNPIGSGGFSDLLTDFFGGSRTHDKDIDNDKDNENYDEYENQNCIAISNKYKYLQNYLLKNEWYDENPKESCEKCNLNLKANRSHIINKCSFYSKWRDESMDKIKKLCENNELELEIDNKNLEELIDDLFYQMYNLDKSKRNDIYEILDFIISGFKRV